MFYLNTESEHSIDYITGILLYSIISIVMHIIYGLIFNSTSYNKVFMGKLLLFADHIQFLVASGSNKYSEIL